jgi:hypothetical protein
LRLAGHIRFSAERALLLAELNNVLQFGKEQHNNEKSITHWLGNIRNYCGRGCGYLHDPQTYPNNSNCNSSSNNSGSSFSDNTRSFRGRTGQSLFNYYHCGLCI